MKVEAAPDQPLPLRMTPSVVDIGASQASKQAESALNKAGPAGIGTSGAQQESLHRPIISQMSIKGFPVMVEEENRLL